MEGTNKRQEKHKPKKNMERMDNLVVKRLVDRYHYLSFVSEADMRPKSNITLPFYEGKYKVGCSSCRGLFYFNNFRGKAVVCNLTTNEFMVFNPPPKRIDLWSSCALGYDPKSDDYKVIRNLSNPFMAEVFSFKSNSWKTIFGPGPDAKMESECGVYLDGRCYWAAWNNKWDNLILSFNFRDETFSPLPLPPQLDDRELIIQLFDFEDCLSVVAFKRVEDDNNRFATYFEGCVRRGRSWERLFSVILIDAQKPLGLRDGLLFLQGHSEPTHLMTYDWEKEELREHAIYDMPPSRMYLLSYVKNQVAIPDAKPINGEGVVLATRLALGIRHKLKSSGNENKALKRKAAWKALNEGSRVSTFIPAAALQPKS